MGPAAAGACGCGCVGACVCTECAGDVFVCAACAVCVRPLLRGAWPGGVGVGFSCNGGSGDAGSKAAAGPAAAGVAAAGGATCRPAKGASGVRRENGG